MNFHFSPKSWSMRPTTKFEVCGRLRGPLKPCALTPSTRPVVELLMVNVGSFGRGSVLQIFWTFGLIPSPRGSQAPAAPLLTHCAGLYVTPLTVTGPGFRLNVALPPLELGSVSTPARIKAVGTPFSYVTEFGKRIPS